jgi:hypothetical protein
MLNTRYIIYNDQAPPLVNKSALGNAWFVSNIKQVESADAELSAMDSSFNPAVTAIIDKRFADQLNGLNPKLDSLASIRLESYQPNILKYATSANSDQLAIFSEIYYAKGWNAYIDGQLVPHLRANYILRGMKIPAGKHALEFRFEPETYFTTEKIGMASSGFLILLVIALLLWDLKKRNSDSVKA